MGLVAPNLPSAPGIAEIPGKLHARHFHRNRSGFRRRKTLMGPNTAAHEVQPDEKHGGERRPEHFELGVAVGVLDLLGVRPVAILPHEQSQRALRRHKDDAHQHIGEGELVVDKGRGSGSAVGHHQVLATKK